MMPRTNVSSLFDQKQLTGFTLIELLVTIVIIGLLVTAFNVSSLSSRKKAKQARAKDDLAVIKKASQIILTDLSKWPFGCNPEVDSFYLRRDINDFQSGIYIIPTTGDVDGSGASDCAWEDQDISYWNGPYLDNPNLNDPWSHTYKIDGRYIRKNNQAKSAIYSLGPNGIEDHENNANSDDIFLDLK